jgi:hypothetical protein
MTDWDPLRERPQLDHVRVGAVDLRPGDRVRLRPLGRADILDLALEGRTATVETIEQDFEDRVYLAVTVDDDPGRDLGARRQVGHRFFFGIEEVEPLAPDGGPRPAREAGQEGAGENSFNGGHS